MLKVADIEPVINEEFGSRLEVAGFSRIAPRKWLRSCKLPIREIFVLGALKGCTYSPIWGISCGLAPKLGRDGFRRQSTDKNAVMDLVIDPIDLPGNVPKQTFSFNTGYTTEIPQRQIQTCAEYFVPLALADFDRVHSIQDFCHFFLERSRLRYSRFQFDNYIQHQLVQGFVLILNGKRAEGIEQLHEFCKSMDVIFDDKVLLQHIEETDAVLKRMR